MARAGRTGSAYSLIASDEVHFSNNSYQYLVYEEWFMDRPYLVQLKIFNLVLFLLCILGGIYAGLIFISWKTTDKCKR